MMTKDTMIINLTYNCPDGLDSINISVISVNRIEFESESVNKTLKIQKGNVNSGRVLTLVLF